MRIVELNNNTSNSQSKPLANINRIANRYEYIGTHTKYLDYDRYRVHNSANITSYNYPQTTPNVF